MENNLPKHLAIIMDGNGRWAKARHHQRYYGHVRGAKVAKTIIEFCAQKGLKHLTLFAFSADNWQRPKSEINFLMNLLNRQLQRESNNLIKNNIRLRSIGHTHRLPTFVRKTLEEVIESSYHCTGMELVLALSYSGQREICDGLKKMANLISLGKLKASEITSELISHSLDSSFLPPPDLIIRTSGESRISNFFLWQLAYSEIHFCNKYWPDFSKEDLFLSFQKFAKSERRYGQVEVFPRIQAP